MESQLSAVKNKFYLLLLTALVSAVIYWLLVKNNLEQDVIQHGLGWALLIAPFLFIVLYMNIEKMMKLAAPVSFTVAVCLGVFLGCLSGIFERGAEGLVIQSVIITCSAVTSIIYFYKNGIINVNDRFLYVTSAIGTAIVMSLMINFVLSIIILDWQSPFTGSSISAIIMNAVVLLLAFMVLSVDLNIVDKSTSTKELSKEETWKLGLDLLVDVAWVYGAVLFLLLRTRGRKSN